MRVRKVKTQSLRKEFEALQFKDGGSVDDFVMCLIGLINNLTILGDTISEEKTIHKFLRVPRRYSQVALSIETLIDLDILSVEELTGRLKAAEEHFELDDDDNDGGRLLLSEDEWLVRLRKCEHDGSSGSGGHNTNNRRRSK